jgi:hypothetical protein
MGGQPTILVVKQVANLVGSHPTNWRGDRLTGQAAN